MQYRYELEKGGLKYICPACRQRRFVRYIDAETGEHITDDCGRCDREDACGYHMRPSEYFHLSGKQPFKGGSILPRKRNPEPEPSFIDAKTASKSLRGYERNSFCLWLCGVFGEETALLLTEAYHIGTSRHWPGACVFWQQDVTGKVRGGKVMLYNADTGRRVKQPFIHVTWAHKVLKIEPYHLKQCLFGEHLLRQDQGKPVAVVESEKTAIVAAGFMPDFIWLATAGKGNLNKEKLQVLQGRDVTLFPDLGAFDKWAGFVRGMPGVRVSSVLEQRATAEDRTNGLDLADYLLTEHKQALTA